MADRSVEQENYVGERVQLPSDDDLLVDVGPPFKTIECESAQCAADHFAAAVSLGFDVRLTTYQQLAEPEGEELRSVRLEIWDSVRRPGYYVDTPEVKGDETEEDD